MNVTPCLSNVLPPASAVAAIPGRASIQELLAVPADQHDGAWLRLALQWAVELELKTIPPYLCAMWSIVKQSGDAYDTLFEIVIDEMFHMGLACNMLTTLGVTPQIATEAAVPKYPAPLPGNVRPALDVGLEPLSKQLVLTKFMEIEHPDWEPLALFAGEVFATIGALYAAIREAFDQLPDAEITGAHQVTRGSRLFAIRNKDDARRAIDRIRIQGEGTKEQPDPNGELAHYYRFAELWHGNRLIPVGPAKWAYQGAPVAFPKEDEVLPMTPVPAGGFPESHAFDQLYSDLLRALQAVWESGGSLSDAVDAMSALGDPARELMRNRLGPSFLFLP